VARLALQERQGQQLDASLLQLRTEHETSRTFHLKIYRDAKVVKEISTL
jgi:hypothetical protein